MHLPVSRQGRLHFHSVALKRLTGKSVRYYDMAQKELKKETSKSTIGSLQARLLAIHFLLNHSRMHEAWASFGLIARQSQALRLHHRMLKTTHNDWINYEYRKRLFWSIYIYDRILSSLFGRPCTLHDEDIDQEECALADDDDISATACHTTDNGAFCSAAALVHYARLARILGRILRQFYGPVGKSLGLMGLKAVAVECERSLADWQSSLPAYLDYTSLPPAAMSTMTQRQMCTLKLTFTHTQLLLYRPFILYSLGPRRSGNSPQLELWIKHCYDKSIEGAKVTVAECRYLYSRGLLSRAFWLVNYVQFAAIGTLYMYSLLWRDAPQVREVADEAIAEFPIGVAGDLVWQRYLDMLKELREITGGQNGTTIDQVAASFGATGLPAFGEDLMEISDSWADMLFDTTMISDFNIADLG